MPILFHEEVFTPHLNSKYDITKAANEATSNLKEYFARKNKELPENSFEYFGYKLSQKQKELAEQWRDVYYLPI